jgi:hypothetical protein
MCFLMDCKTNAKADGRKQLSVRKMSHVITYHMNTSSKKSCKFHVLHVPDCVSSNNYLLLNGNSVTEVNFIDLNRRVSPRDRSVAEIMLCYPCIRNH